MRDNKLMKYLECVIEIEKTIYVQEYLIDELKGKIAKLGIRRDFPYPSESHSSMKQCFEMSSSGGIVIGAVVGAVIGLISGSGIIGSILNMFASGIGGLIIGGIAGALTTPIWYGIGYAMAGSRLKEAIAERDADVCYDNERVKKELAQAANLKKMLSELEKKHNESKALRLEYYRNGPIYEDYRNIVAVCSFYQYINSGRCDTLTGHEGAYNIYENEQRLYHICTMINEIRADISQIKNYQVHLYNVLQEGNKKIDNLLAESVRQSNTMQKISEQNAIIEYNTGVARRELEMHKWLKVYELSKSGY